MSRKFDRRQFVMTSVSAAAASRRLFAGPCRAAKQSGEADRHRLGQRQSIQEQRQGHVRGGRGCAARGDTKGVRITLDIASAQRQGTIFVIARPAGVTAGPPIAAKRVDTQSFPTTVELTQADSMMGQPLPATMRIEARLDSDGNAMTKAPGDPSAVRDGVTAGSVIKLTLK